MPTQLGLPDELQGVLQSIVVDFGGSKPKWSLRRGNKRVSLLVTWNDISNFPSSKVKLVQPHSDVKSADQDTQSTNTSPQLKKKRKSRSSKARDNKRLLEWRKRRGFTCEAKTKSPSVSGSPNSSGAGAPALSTRDSNSPEVEKITLEPPGEISAPDTALPVETTALPDEATPLSDEATIHTGEAATVPDANSVQSPESIQSDFATIEKERASFEKERASLEKREQTLIAVEEHRTTVTSHPNACHGCKKPADQCAESLKRCIKCNFVKYCSRKCQKSHWKLHHKYICRPELLQDMIDLSHQHTLDGVKEVMNRFLEN